MARMDFDSETVPDEGFSPLPAGWYRAKASASEMKQTSSGDGSYLTVTLDILGPAFAGRKVWARFNLKNSSAQAVEIGRKQLAQYCRAVSVAKLRDSEQLHGRVCEVKVSVRSQEGYDDSNDVKAFRPVEGLTFADPAPQAAPQAAPQRRTTESASEASLRRPVADDDIPF